MNEKYFCPRNPFEATGIVKRPWDQQVFRTLNDHTLALHTSPFFYRIPSQIKVAPPHKLLTLFTLLALLSLLLLLALLTLLTLLTHYTVAHMPTYIAIWLEHLKI